MANFDVKIQHPIRVEKQWGYELWIHNDSQYCGKLLVFFILVLNTIIEKDYYLIIN